MFGALLTAPHTYTSGSETSAEPYGSTPILQCLTQSQCLSADYNVNGVGDRTNDYNLNRAAEGAG